VSGAVYEGAESEYREVKNDFDPQVVHCLTVVAWEKLNPKRQRANKVLLDIIYRRRKQMA
jgi:hypothetical protein